MRRLLLVVLAACALGVGGAHAQSYPSRTITIIVPFPAGGSTDTVARIMAEGMQSILGQPVEIDNVVGGSGSAGVEKLARAAPDGYTSTLASGTPTSAALLTSLRSTWRRLSHRSA